MKDLHFQQQHPNMNHNNNQQNLHQHTFNQHQSTMVQQQILNQQSHLILSNLQQDNKTRSHSRLPGIKYDDHNLSKISIIFSFFLIVSIHHKIMIRYKYLLATAQVHCPI